MILDTNSMLTIGIVVLILLTILLARHKEPQRQQNIMSVILTPRVEQTILEADEEGGNHRTVGRIKYEGDKIFLWLEGKSKPHIVNLIEDEEVWVLRNPPISAIWFNSQNFDEVKIHLPRLWYFQQPSEINTP